MRGAVTAQYIQKPGPLVGVGVEKSSNGIAKKVCMMSWHLNLICVLVFQELSVELTAMYVPGKNTIVRKAMPFIAELSRLDAAAISRESAASTVEYSDNF